MDKSKDTKQIFHLKRSAMIQNLKDKLYVAQCAFEGACEKTMPTREKTVVFLVDEKVVLGNEIKEVTEEAGCRLEIVHNEFNLFHEVGKNSIVAVIVEVGETQYPTSTIASLKKRNIPTFVVAKNKSSKLDMWRKAFGKCYSWPKDLSTLISDIKVLCDC